MNGLRVIRGAPLAPPRYAPPVRVLPHTSHPSRWPARAAGLSFHERYPALERAILREIRGEQRVDEPERTGL